MNRIPLSAAVRQLSPANPRDVGFGARASPTRAVCVSPERLKNRGQSRRPLTLSEVDLVEHALRCTGLIVTSARRADVSVVRSMTPSEIAIDVASRMIEIGAHRRYDPGTASIDAYLSGFAFTYYRKLRQTRARRADVESRAKPPSAAPVRSARFVYEEVERVASRVTPTAATVLRAGVRIGGFRVDPIAAGTGLPVSVVRACLAEIRDVARFVSRGNPGDCDISSGNIV